MPDRRNARLDELRILMAWLTARADEAERDGAWETADRLRQAADVAEEMQRDHVAPAERIRRALERAYDVEHTRCTDRWTAAKASLSPESCSRFTQQALQHSHAADVLEELLAEFCRRDLERPNAELPADITPSPTGGTDEEDHEDPQDDGAAGHAHHETDHPHDDTRCNGSSRPCRAAADQAAPGAGS